MNSTLRQFDCLWSAICRYWVRLPFTSLILGLTALLMLPWLAFPDATFAAALPFQEQNNLVVLEAEHASAIINRSSAAWTTESSLSGAGNNTYLTALPNSGANINTNIATTSPELQFRIQFTHPGTYYLWVRMQNDDATSNSIHIGLDGTLVPSADAMSDETTFRTWGWSQHTIADQSAKVIVPTAGEHTLNVWMREDGVRLDRILLTGDAQFVPVDQGPTESKNLQPIAAPFSARINFQPAGMPVPNTYVADIGQSYGDRGNGMIYGWNSDLQALARQRRDAASPDVRYDTFIHMQKLEAPNARWELKLPNGAYHVRIVAGDPTMVDTTIAIQAENTVVAQGKPTANQRWIDSSATVEVTDGALTLSNAPGSVNNKIAFVEIVPVSVTESITPPVSSVNLPIIQPASTQAPTTAPTQAPTAAPTQVSTQAQSKTPLLGVLYNSAIPTSAIEQWTGRKNAVAVWFVNWDSVQIDHIFNDVLPLLWNNGNVPMVTWGPSFSNGTPNNIDVLVARGDYDGYLNTFSDRMRAWLSGPDGQYGTGDDRRVYLRLGHEMNGNWYPWSVAGTANTTGDYIAMWQHVVTLFRNKGLDSSHIQWIWCATGEDVGGVKAEQYYPGDAYVDWVGVDSYNFGTSASWSHWQSPAQSFDPMLGRLRALTTKPVAIPEVGTTTSGGSVAAKSQWVTDLYTYAQTQQIGLIAYFNTEKETDWAIFGGKNGDGSVTDSGRSYAVYNAYKQAIQPLTGADVANPRLLTDAQFAGR